MTQMSDDKKVEQVERVEGVDKTGKQPEKEDKNVAGQKKPPKPKSEKSPKLEPSDIAAVIANRGTLRYSDVYGWLKYDSKRFVWKGRKGKDADLPFRKEIYNCLISAKMNSMRNYDEVIHVLKALVWIADEEINPNPDIINLANGLYNHKTGKFKPHETLPRAKLGSCGTTTCDYISTVILPFQYDPTAECPNWIAFLEQTISDDHEVIMTVQEIIGTLFIGNKFQQLYFLIGDGRNGKGTFMRICQKLVGKENCSSVSMDALGDKFVRARLHDKLLNLSGEIPKGRVKTEQWLKALSGGDDIEAEYKYSQSFAFRVHANFLFAMNELPELHMDQALYERIIVLKFPNTFIGQNADANLEHTLADELSGIFNWAIKGLRRIQKRGRLELPELLQNDKKNFLLCTDPLWNFAMCCLEKSPDSEVLASDLREVFKEHLETHFGKKVVNVDQHMKLPSRLIATLRPLKWDIRTRLVNGRTIVAGIKIRRSFD